MFLIMFKTRHALLLPGGRFLRPRNGRGEAANQSRNMNCSRPQTRHVREYEQAQDRSQSRSIHVREQPVSAFSPRQQAQQRSVRIRDHGKVSTGNAREAATDVNRPQSDHRRELSASEVSTRTGIRHESELTTNRPWRNIAAATAPSTSFPVHIRRSSINVLV